MVLKNVRTGNILTVTSKDTIEIMTAYSDIYVPYTPVKAEEKPAETADEKTDATVEDKPAETAEEKPTKPTKGKSK